MKIGLFYEPRWAPGCLLIVQVDDNGHPIRNPKKDESVSVLVQSDYDFPGVAATFCWEREEIEDEESDEIQEATEWLFEHASYLGWGPAELITEDPGYF
jgi:hypothetical protein